ncbi:MAG: hypothetical protein LQ344_004614 [Seirophora lacunosa]|nr:MAG: hypothetical protein LQ344_004614 [Seirophora lacunosa]
MTSPDSTAKKLAPSKTREALQEPNQQKVLHEERRRQQFLQKVNRKRDDWKWDLRSEQILREDFIASQLQWLESQNRSAPPVPNYPGSDDKDGIHPYVEGRAENMIDQVLSQEFQEVEALVTMLENCANEGGLDKDRPTRYESNDDLGSDDEGYHANFTEFSSESAENNNLRPDIWQASAISKEQVDHDEAMDITG